MPSIRYLQFPCWHQRNLWVSCPAVSSIVFLDLRYFHHVCLLYGIRTQEQLFLFPKRFPNLFSVPLGLEVGLIAISADADCKNDWGQNWKLHEPIATLLMFKCKGINGYHDEKCTEGETCPFWAFGAVDIVWYCISKLTISIQCQPRNCEFRGLVMMQLALVKFGRMGFAWSATPRHSRHSTSVIH